MAFGVTATTSTSQPVTATRQHNIVSVQLDTWSIQDMSAAMQYLLAQVQQSQGDPATAILTVVAVSRTFTLTWDAPLGVTP